MVEKTAIRSNDAPTPIGPYSTAIRCGNWLFCSGQIALDPRSGALQGSGDVAAQAEQALRNLQAVLTAGGATLRDVVKTTIFLTSMDDFSAVNEVYGRYFAMEQPPARSTVAVAGLPKAAKVEIEAIAVLPTGHAD